MSDVVAALGTSHSVMLAPQPKHLWAVRAAQDKVATDYLDNMGNPTDFATLVATTGDRYKGQLDPEVWQAKWDQAHRDIERLRADLHALEPDLLLIIGDDQRELFFDTLQPPIAVFMGDTVKMSKGQVPHDAPPEDAAKIREFLAGLGCDGRAHSGDSEAALHVVKSLTAQGFDAASMSGLPGDREFGHAFGFVLGPLLDGRAIQSVPIMLNTYYPPNQPTPARSYDLGAALARAVSDMPGDRRVAVVASGGLSHFVVDEELDRRVLEAFAARDVAALRTLPEHRLNSGTSEIRNWLAAAGAAGSLRLRWSDYVPAYRSEAGTGIGLAFAFWS